LLRRAEVNNPLPKLASPPFCHEEADQRFPTPRRKLERDIPYIDGRGSVGTKNFALMQKNSWNLAARKIEQYLLGAVRSG
jgi:hypothetical protein